MGNFISRFIFFKLLRWQFKGVFPTFNKYIVAVVPHTSNYDFLMGLIVRSISQEQINYVGKKELFNPLTAWFFKGLGGAPINRGKREKTVDAIARIYNNREKFRLAIAPEGTRKKVTEWKTGFYHIAKAASIPIIPVAFDYGKKEVVVHPPFYPKEDMDQDFAELKKLFKGVVGKIPENS